MPKERTVPKKWPVPKERPVHIKVLAVLDGSYTGSVQKEEKATKE